MSNQKYGTILVIGNDPDNIIKKYSLDTKVKEYLYVKFDDAGKLKKKNLELLSKLIETKSNTLTDGQVELLKYEYQQLQEMDDFDYFREKTEGCRYDEETGDAYSDVNPKASYQYERSPQKRLDATGEESDFSNPFKLLNGEISYVAKKGDIDWSLMHLYNTGIYEAAWELVIDGRVPVDGIEENIKNNMINRRSYFEDNFSNKKEYVLHSCSFWCYGVATKDKYDGLSYKKNDKEWVANFYNKFIKDLPDDTLLSIYEVKLI